MNKGKHFFTKCLSSGSFLFAVLMMPHRGGRAACFGGRFCVGFKQADTACTSVADAALFGRQVAALWWRRLYSGGWLPPLPSNPVAKLAD